MNRFFKLGLIFCLSFIWFLDRNQHINATPIDAGESGIVVNSTASTPIDVQATLVDGTFTFNTNGTYPTINENLNNGFEVEIISGGGNLTLTGNQTANLRINNANAPINIINANSSKTLYLSNANVTLVNSRIDTTNNYAIDVNSHVRLLVDATSFVRAQSGYASAIIVNVNQNDIQFVIDGTVESNQQGIGVDSGSRVESIVVNGKLISNANYGLIATTTGEIGDVTFTNTSEAINPAGLVVYIAAAQGKIGNIVFDGTINSRIIATIGAIGAPASAGNITLNNSATVQSGAFYLNGTISSLNITSNASITQLINNYGILYTREGTVLDKYYVQGNITSSYLLVDSYATSLIKDVLIDPVGINTGAVVTQNSMLWISGHINNLTITPKVFEVDGLNYPFNFRQTSQIDNMVVNQSIIDTKINPPGVLFNNQALSNVSSLTLNDTLLFGEANQLSVATQPLTHVEPNILTTNLNTNNGVVTIDLEIPELSTLPNVSTTGVKLTYMFNDYSHQNDFMYYGGVQTITIPTAVINKNQPFYFVNYAQYDLNDDVVLTSNRSQYYEVATYLLSFNLNGGQGTAPATQQLVEGALANAVNTPIKNGYTFQGWNTALDGTGITWDFASSIMPANDVTLYAQWKKNVNPDVTFNLSFNLNGGQGNTPPNQKLKVGQLAKQPTNPIRNGYTFKEWNTSLDGSGTSWNFKATKMPAKNTTLYAQWIKNLPHSGYDVTTLVAVIGLLGLSTSLYIYKRKFINN